MRRPRNNSAGTAASGLQGEEEDVIRSSARISDLRTLQTFNPAPPETVANPHCPANKDVADASATALVDAVTHQLIHLEWIFSPARHFLKQDKTCKLGMKGKRLQAGWDNDYMLQLLGP